VLKHQNIIHIQNPTAHLILIHSGGQLKRVVWGLVVTDRNESLAI